MMLTLSHLKELNEEGLVATSIIKEIESVANAIETKEKDTKSEKAFELTR